MHIHGLLYNRLPLKESCILMDHHSLYPQHTIPYKITARAVQDEFAKFFKFWVPNLKIIIETKFQKYISNKLIA